LGILPPLERGRAREEVGELGREGSGANRVGRAGVPEAAGRPQDASRSMAATRASSLLTMEHAPPEIRVPGLHLVKDRVLTDSKQGRK
jgi:hypothetical protein